MTTAAGPGPTAGDPIATPSAVPTARRPAAGTTGPGPVGAQRPAGVEWETHKIMTVPIHAQAAARSYRRFQNNVP